MLCFSFYFCKTIALTIIVMVHWSDYCKLQDIVGDHFETHLRRFKQHALQVKHVRTRVLNTNSRIIRDLPNHSCCRNCVGNWQNCRQFEKDLFNINFSAFEDPPRFAVFNLHVSVTSKSFPPEILVGTNVIIKVIIGWRIVKGEEWFLGQRLKKKKVSKYM